MDSLRLYGRHACHLCEVMEEELRTLLAGTDVTLTIKDVDERQDWRVRYGQRVPVLETADGTELCHFHLDEKAVLGWLQAETGKPVS